ncbi:MAG: hypothetical protein AMK71_09805 [Nitrospira bacterium SG8_35_4]|nr:MAG: hypothetical protein AMK71_09805 [Nitrospira bacterium SG8_35_4]
MAREDYSGSENADSLNTDSEVRGEKHRTDIEAYEEIKEIFAEIREISNTKEFLAAQNKELKAKRESLSSEIDGMEIVAASMKKDIEVTLQRTEASLEKMKDLNGKREQLIEEINSMKKSIKILAEDNNKCQIMKEHLLVEFESISHEKAIIFKKLKEIEEGVKRLTSKKNVYNVPYLRAYDSLLKRVYRAFKEAEDRMDVSLKLLH